ncbi:hypothetical protein AKJ16_DCAP20281 [Drosera capensis]
MVYRQIGLLRPEGIMQGSLTKKLIVSTLALFFLACDSFAAIHEDEPRTNRLGSSDHRAIFGRHGVHNDGNVELRIPSEALFRGRPLERLLRAAMPPPPPPATGTSGHQFTGSGNAISPPPPPFPF